MKRFQALIILVFLLATCPKSAFSQQLSADAEVYAAIRKEAMENSQIMKTLHIYTDLYGPRLTGSPQLKQAGEWSIRKMKEWGFDKAGLEPWELGYAGWTNERVTGFINSPVQDTLVLEVLAWTPGTTGAVKGEAVRLDIPSEPTPEALSVYMASVRHRIRGKMVLVGKPAVIPVNFDPPAKRTSEEELRKTFAPDAPPSPGRGAPPTPKPGILTAQAVNAAIDAFLLENGAAVRLNDAAREHGQIRAFDNRTKDVSKAPPTVILRNEDFGRISRLLDSGHQVELEFDIRNKVHPEGKTAYNAVGEIVGTDKRDEIVMLGAHLDGWHAATGATDNAIGCAVMMEAGRILKALGVKPRRTIRLALWSGEEQGILGSEQYVFRHLGTVENPKPEFFKLSAYLNSDSGTGRPRGFTVFGPPEAALPLREVATAFADLGMVGATTTIGRRRGGSDQSVFNMHGLPGIWTSIDPIEYFTHTWHTNLDT